MKEIQEAIEKGKIDKIDYVNYKVIEYPNEFLYCYDKSELLHLLSLVAEKQRGADYKKYRKYKGLGMGGTLGEALRDNALVTNNPKL